MSWFFFSFLTAIFSASEAAIIKRWLGHLNCYDMIACTMGWSWPFFVVSVFAMDGYTLGQGFWPELMLFVPVNILGILLQFEAIRVSPLSLTMPFMAFTPAFMIGTGFVALGELPTIWGLTGILLIVAGSWVLSHDPAGKGGLLEPFKAILRERGSRLALCASVVWSVGAVMSKRLTLETDPVYAGAVFFAVHNAVLVLGLFIWRKSHPRILLRYPAASFGAACVLTLHIACHYLAISIVNAAYMVSIKRLNGVISVLLGWLFFGDTQIKSRLAGASIMACGAAVIALWG